MDEHKLQEMGEQYMRLVGEARALHEKAVTEKRDMTGDEEAKYGELIEKAASVKRSMDRSKALQDAERQVEVLRESAGRRSEPDETAQRSEPDGEPEKRKKDEDAYKRAFSRWCGAQMSTGDVLMSHPERRAMQSDQDNIGGYLVTPMEWSTQLLKDIDDAVYLRQWATKFQLRQATSLGVIRRTAAMSTFAWSSEVGAPTADTAYRLGQRALSPHYLTGSVLVSRDLLRRAMIPPEDIVRSEFAKDSGEVQEDAFFGGSGAQQPLGLLTASSDGISTGQDVSTGNTTTSMTFDGLLEAKWALKPGYWPAARWLFHVNGGKQLAKLKDGDGNYMWRASEGVRAGEPSRLLDFPVFFTNRSFMNTFTTGLYVGLLGDFSKYWIADALDMEFQRLDELNARANQVEFIGRMKTDGMPQVEEAFIRVKLA